MYQVKVMNRQSGEVIMESDTFSTMAEADELVRSVGQGEGYYSMVFKLDAVWSDLLPAQGYKQAPLLSRKGGRGYDRKKYTPVPVLKIQHGASAAMVCALTKMIILLYSMYHTHKQIFYILFNIDYNKIITLSIRYNQFCVGI